MNVAVGVITDSAQRILITQRSLKNSHSGLWEFPGGKLEVGELATSALVRELNEELGIDVSAYRFLGEVHHTYNQQSICLLVYHVYEFEGEAICREGQMNMQWVEYSALKKYNFPEANIKIMKLISQSINEFSLLNFS